MTTALDTNVLLDVFLPDDAYLDGSSRLLRRAYDDGALEICHLVYAELVPQFVDRMKLDEALTRLNVRISPIDDEVAFLAGTRWLKYRIAGGTRERMISDFLIGAHAELRSDRFLTRDRGFYKTHFPNLKRLQ